MILTVVNQKGGVGKTSLVVNLAGLRSRRGRRVMVVDTDPQGSLLQWHSVSGGEGVDVVHLPQSSLAGPLGRFDRRYDDVLVDTPPALGARLRSVLGVCTMALVPIGPSPLDIWSSRETVDMIRAAKTRNRRLRGRLVVSRKIGRTRLGREARSALETYGLPICDAEISQRIAYVEAMVAGRSVCAHAPHSTAAEEIDALCRELFG